MGIGQCCDAKFTQENPILLVSGGFNGPGPRGTQEAVAGVCAAYRPGPGGFDQRRPRADTNVPFLGPSRAWTLGVDPSAMAI